MSCRAELRTVSACFTMLGGLFVIVISSAAHAMDASSSTLQQGFELPPLADVRSGTTAMGSFQFTTIRVEGVTVFDATEISAITRPYLNRQLLSHDLDSLREELSQLYVTRGYINSGVRFPDQQNADSTLVLEAVEGVLADIDVVSNGRLSIGYIQPRLAINRLTPLNVNDLGDAIKLLQADPRVGQVNAELMPGAEPGQAGLRVEVTPAKTNGYIEFGADNLRSESIGAERGSVSFGHLNLLGRGDALQAGVSISDGAETAFLSYSYPLGRVRLGAYAGRSDADIIEAPFASLDIESVTDTFGLQIEVPLAVSTAGFLHASAGFEYRESTSRLLGNRFSLSPGAVNGDSGVRVGWLGLEWISRADDRVLALTSTVRHGFDIWGATQRADDATLSTDGEFTSFVVQGQYVRELPQIGQLIVRSIVQLTPDPLLALEKFAIGGRQTVRGFRENLIVRDNGWTFSSELKRPLFTRDGFPGSVEASLFSDWGGSWDDVDTAPFSNRDTDDIRTIGSVGIGVLWRPWKIASLQIYYGEHVYDNFDGDDPRDSFVERGLQDDGLHFELAFRRDF